MPLFSFNFFPTVDWWGWAELTDFHLAAGSLVQ